MNARSATSRRYPLAAKFSLLLCVALLQGCMLAQRPIELTPLEPLAQPAADDEAKAAAKSAGAAATEPTADQRRFTRGPGVPAPRDVADLPSAAQAAPQLSGEPISSSFSNVPLPAFINQVFGSLLGLSFEISPDLSKRTDLITLRITEPQAPDALYSTALNVLRSYGVSAQWADGLLRFQVAKQATSDTPPLLVSGRALPEVPVSHRTVFQLVPLRVVRDAQLKTWLSRIFQGQPLSIQTDLNKNAIILEGTPALVRQAVEAAEWLDRPNLRGSHSLKIEPLFVRAPTLAEHLGKVLAAEGYGVSNNPDLGSINILPLEALNAVLVFAADQQIIAHVRDWAEKLDTPPRGGSESALHYYKVKHTSAQGIADVVEPLVTDLEVKPEGKDGKKPAKPRLVVDQARNGLVFYGPGETWANLLPTIRDMDQSPKQVMIEVTVAEVTLTDAENFGVEWLIRGSVGSTDLSASTEGFVTSEGALPGGFNFLLDSAGKTRLVINALATNNRVNILSTPSVLVRNGATANLEVGSDVPIITSQGTAADLTQEGTSAILQNIQYRKTGTLLKVTPTIYSGRRVELDITQEVSLAEPNKINPSVDSPTILNRRINTQLGLRDGGSVLLGGLMERNTSSDERKVPLLGDLPVLGQLFRSDGVSDARTELVMLVIPYIVDDDSEAEDLTRAFRERQERNAAPDKSAAKPE